MEKKLIKKAYKEKIKLINKFNKKYYNENLSEISDAEYDYLKKEIISLEKKYKYLKSKDSPSQTIGYKPSKNFKKVLHKVPMLSLGNAFSEDDLLNFEKRIMSSSLFRNSGRINCRASSITRSRIESNSSLSEKDKK